MTHETTSALAGLAGAFLISAVLSPLAGQVPGDPGRSFQAGTNLGLGYVVNAPEQLLGFTVMTVGSSWSGWGAFADVKLAVDRVSGDDAFRESSTATEAIGMGHQRFGEPEEEWTTFNVGLVRALTDDVAAYLGGGYSEQTVYQEFDQGASAGIDRFYIVEDDRFGGNEVNILGGLYLRVSRVIAFQFGGETAPAGFTAGVSLMVPLGG